MICYTTSMKPDGKAAQNKLKKREALMQAGYELFTEKGVGHTSIADIAERAGIGKGTFYSYFEDKYDIHDHIVAQKASMLFENAQKALENNTQIILLEDQVIFFSDNILNQLKEDKVLLRFIYKNLSWGVFTDILDSRTTAFGKNIRSLIDIAIKRSDVKYRDAYGMLYLITEMLGAVSYSSILDDHPKPIDEFKPDLYEAIRAIMKQRELH